MKNVFLDFIGRIGVLPLVLGLSDGILTAVTLAAGQLVTPGHEITMLLAVRIASAAFVSGSFVYFVAQYSRLRGELVRAERELNLTARGRLAASRLGRSVLIEALTSATVSSLASFVGALIPLLTGALFPSFGWGALIASVVSLGILGAGIARTVHGNYWRWSACLMAGGIVLSVVGIKLHIV